jgi:hypothetical protein
MLVADRIIVNKGMVDDLLVPFFLNLQQNFLFFFSFYRYNKVISLNLEQTMEKETIEGDAPFCCCCFLLFFFCRFLSNFSKRLMKLLKKKLPCYLKLGNVLIAPKVFPKFYNGI